MYTWIRAQLRRTTHTASLHAVSDILLIPLFLPLPSEFPPCRALSSKLPAGIREQMGSLEALKTERRCSMFTGWKTYCGKLALLLTRIPVTSNATEALAVFLAVIGKLCPKFIQKCEGPHTRTRCLRKKNTAGGVTLVCFGTSSVLLA